LVLGLGRFLPGGKGVVMSGVGTVCN
jgi:hypothetical protein